jgi:AraC-like DNA-binding protein
MHRAEQVRCQTTPDGIEFLEATYHTHTFERHIHETYAIGLTLSGVQRFWCRGATHDSLAGTSIVIGPGQSHDGQSGSAGGYSYRMVYVPMSVLQDIVGDACETTVTDDIGTKTPLVRDRQLALAFNRTWSALTHESQRPPADLLGDVILDLASRHAGIRVPAISTVDAVAVARVRDYLHAHVDRDVRAGELAELASMSRFQLTRQFERAFGLPLHAYHLHLRLEESKRRMRTGEPVAAVAANLGFADQSHFHRRFKGAFGVTPGQWRQSALQTLK